MSAFENELKKYKKRGFVIKKKRTLKYGKKYILGKDKSGLSGLIGAFDALYIYYADGDSNAKNIPEFLKDYRKTHEKNDWDMSDKSIFICSGSLNRELFKEFRDALIRDSDLRKTINMKVIKEAVARKKKRVVEEETIREKNTEMEITRRRVTEKHISTRGLINKIKKFEPHVRTKKEKQLENMLVSYLQANYDVQTQMNYGRAIIDAQVGNIGIEIKHAPSSGDFDRLYGQIEKYLDRLEQVIVVIANEKSKEITKSFQQRLKERGWLNKRVFVITK